MKRNALCLLLAAVLILCSACALGEASTLFEAQEIKQFELSENEYFHFYKEFLFKRDRETGKRAAYDLFGNMLVDYKYMDISVKTDNLLQVQDDAGNFGAIDIYGGVIIPLEYYEIDWAGDKWQIGTKVEAATEADRDYKGKNDGEYYKITAHDVYFDGKLVGWLPRDGVKKNHFYSDRGDYLYVEDRSGNLVFYDKQFNARGTSGSDEFKYDKERQVYIHQPTGERAFYADCTLDPESLEYPYRYNWDTREFVNIRGEVLFTLGEEFHNIRDFYEGYAIAPSADLSSGIYGIIDISGNTVIPCEYRFHSSISEYIFINGYQMVYRDGVYGFYNSAGEITCPVEHDLKSLKYDLYNHFYVHEAEGGYSIVTPMGKLKDTYADIERTFTHEPMLSVVNAEGMRGLIDYYGNMILPYQNASLIICSNSGAAALVRDADGKTCTLYSIKRVGDETAMARPAADKWACDCGRENYSRFCPDCGTPRPAALITVCPNCATEADDPAKPPKFCPECGTPMNPAFPSGEG